MNLPRNLVLLRHGESESNRVKKLLKKGGLDWFANLIRICWRKKFRKRPSSTFRLTDKGREQAEIAGKWIRENIGLAFDGYYVSEYLRAMETAGRLSFLAQWKTDFCLNERSWGRLMIVPEEAKELNDFYWRPRGGESMPDVCLRWDRFMDRLIRECPNRDVIVVCHREMMRAARARIEKMSQWEYRALVSSGRVKDRIHNCQILHYSREDPKTKTLSENFDWMRSVCPTDISRSDNFWMPIKRKGYTNSELLKIAEETPRMIE